MNITPEQRLQDILDTMDVPKLRKTDWRWLKRNLGVRNTKHLFFNEAMSIIDSLLLTR